MINPERLTSASPEEITQLYDELAPGDLPAWNTATNDVTFIYRVPGAPAGVGVHLRINRLTDKANFPRGVMHRVPGTDVWVLTLNISPTLRASYGFSTFTGPAPTHTPPPGFGAPPTKADPFNPSGTAHTSILAGPYAPAQPEWEAADAELSGSVSKRAWDNLGGKPVHLYVPPRPARSLLLLTDAERWLGDVFVPRALERAGGPLGEVAVVGVGNVDKNDRLASLGENPAFISELVEGVVPWARRETGATGPTIFAGQSMGGVTAIAAALRHPGAFDGVIAQSPSMWWQPGQRPSPALLGSTTRDYLPRLADSLPSDPRTRIALSVGAQENATVAHVAGLELYLRARGWRTRLTIEDGGHDYAWWRGDLLAQLTTMIGPHGDHSNTSN
ncbi:alpha/beta hydrolase-fold protein [Corynebacterium auris]|uniref:alpha/beta hydrolase-fold protein n=1 Tax=Corynebacterium auris TaxID=44750 RepID=UPI0025B2C344|nr:alpha/beta hydrolase-fold protein [Corynebacterium auris]WJY68449.1 Enterochelin esterase [Corynebacterium auris]